MTTTWTSAERWALTIAWLLIAQVRETAYKRGDLHAAASLARVVELVRAALHAHEPERPATDGTWRR